jgi:hypothetical protein
MSIFPLDQASTSPVDSCGEAPPQGDRGTAFTTQTDAQGMFRIVGAPVGTVKLIVDGSTSQRPGAWPDLEFVLTTIPGRDNTLGMPIYLLPLNLTGGLLVDETHGGTLTLPDVPGFALELLPGSVTFPGGGKSGVVSVTVVHNDKVPMVPNFGQQPLLIVTIQPAGARFEPPARLTVPNVEGFAPGQVAELYSFDHDLGHFVSIGPGTVSEDGTVITSNHGVGIVKAGWHCCGFPQGSGAPNHCPQCTKCSGDDCVPTNLCESCSPAGNACDGVEQRWLPSGGSYRPTLDLFCGPRLGKSTLQSSFGPGSLRGQPRSLPAAIDLTGRDVHHHRDPDYFHRRLSGNNPDNHLYVWKITRRRLHGNRALRNPMSPRKSIRVRISWLLFLLPLTSCGAARHDEPASTHTERLSSCLDSTAGPSLLEERITATFEGTQLPEALDHLAELGIPVSFIEGPSPVQIEMRVQDEPVRSFLGLLLGQARDYKCAVIENHVVIYHDEPALHKMVKHVSITEQLRGRAAGSYVKHVSHQIEEFKDLSVLLGGPLDSPVLEEKVTLAREATVLEHLGQLLGKNPDIVFWLRYASTGSRYLNLGSVLRRRVEPAEEKPSPSGELP